VLPKARRVRQEYTPGGVEFGQVTRYSELIVWKDCNVWIADYSKAIRDLHDASYGKLALE